MDYKKTLKILQEYYSNLLIVQYNGRPKAKETIQQLVNLVYASMILLQIQDAFDWKTAVGEQLNIIGQWVGVSRSYNKNLIVTPKLSYPQYPMLATTPPTVSLLQGGYSDYETFDDNDGGQLRYEDLQSITNELEEEDYRIIIGLKIIYNSINHTAGEIDKAIWEYFNHDVVTVWSDRTLIYQYPSEYEGIMQIAYYKGVLPAPIGTQIQLVQV